MSTILRLVHAHEGWRGTTLNLLASENILSPMVREALGSDLASRYSLEIHAEVHGEYVENAYRGTRYAEEIIHRTGELACGIFGSRYAVTEPLSGHVAGMVVLLSCLEKRELLLTTAIGNGGYDGYAGDYIPEMFGYRSGHLPFSAEEWKLAETAPDVIRHTGPGAVVVGSSFILFPYDLKPLREACDDVGAVLVYDASHVLGLIAGGEFQPDAMRYCDVVYGSTHKSLFGPQGGIILTNDGDLHERMRFNLTWRTIDNPHLNRIAGLGIALEEMDRWGAEYAGRVVRNARALGRELTDRGVPVARAPAFTESHQLHLDPVGIREGFGLTMNGLGIRLEEHDIIVDAVGRLGTAEATRIGMREPDMATVADLIRRAMAQDGGGGGDREGSVSEGRVVPSKGDLAAEVRAFRGRFGMEFTLD